MKDPCVSELTTLCKVQVLTTQPDGMGGQEAVIYGQLWIDYFIFWAKLDWGSGSEKIVMGRVQASGSANLVARFDSRLSTDMRIVLDDGNILNIRSVDNRQQRSLWMDIVAEQGVGT